MILHFGAVEGIFQDREPAMKFGTNLRELKKNSNQPIPDKQVKIIANSIYQSLREEGCREKDIIGVSSQLIGLVTSAMENDQKSPDSK